MGWELGQQAKPRAPLCREVRGWRPRSELGRQVERTCRRLLGEQAGRKDRGGQSARERRQSKEPDGKQ